METGNNQPATAAFNILTLALGIAGAAVTVTVTSISPDNPIYDWQAPVRATAAMYVMSAVMGFLFMAWAWSRRARPDYLGWERDIRKNTVIIGPALLASGAFFAGVSLIV